MKISVLICTRNRASSLRQTLDAVFAQRLPKELDYEVVVVDNGSRDETRRVVREFMARHSQCLRYFYEWRPGLSQARNAGLRVVSGEVVAFTDDDVLVREDWLAGIACEFAADPELYLLAGRVLPARAGLQPVGLQEAAEPHTFYSPEGASFAVGANIAIRREVFVTCGDFDVRLGAGSFFAGADEVELLYRAMRAGYKLRYAPNVTVYHNHDRFTLRQACDLQYNYGKGHVAYLLKHVLGGDRNALRLVYWSSVNLLKRCVGWKRTHPASARFARAHLCGMIVALLPALFRMRQKENSDGLTEDFVGRPSAEVDSRVVAVRRDKS